MSADKIVFLIKAAWIVVLILSVSLTAISLYSDDFRDYPKIRALFTAVH